MTKKDKNDGIKVYQIIADLDYLCGATGIDEYLLYVPLL